MRALLFVILFVPLSILSQEWIRYNKEVIETHLTSINVEYTTSVLDNGDLSLFFSVDDEYMLGLIFTKNHPYVCYMEIYTPFNDRALNSLIKWYNTNGIKISDTEWQIYYKGDISEVRLRGDVELTSIIVKYLNTYKE